MTKERTYLNTRWQAGYTFHRQQATTHRRLYLGLTVSISAGWVLVLVLLALPDTPPHLPLLAAGFTGFAMLLYALLRPGQRWHYHQRQAERFERERALYETGTGPYAGGDAFNRFVARCENLPDTIPTTDNRPSLPGPFRPRPYQPFSSSSSRFGGYRSLDDDDDFDDDDDDELDDDERLIGRLPFRRTSAATLADGDVRRDERVPFATTNGGPAFCFTAYYPAEAAPESWQPLTAYAYPRIAEDAIAADATGRRPLPAPTYRSPHRTIPEGARVTVIPHLDGFQFNPASVTLGFYRRWHRFNFEMRAVQAPADSAVNGRLNFLVDGVVVGDVPLSVFVSPAPNPDTSLRRVTRAAYGSLLACYSTDDRQVDAALDRVCKALEIECHRAQPGSGDGVRTAVAHADALQVFWSQAVAHKLQPPLETGSSPLHVVYWQQPCPPLPDWLQHVQPVFEPGLAETRR